MAQENPSIQETAAKQGSGISFERLTNEWKAWQENHPLGWSAKLQNGDNVYKWICKIPGIIQISIIHECIVKNFTS